MKNMTTNKRINQPVRYCPFFFALLLGLNAVGLQAQTSRHDFDVIPLGVKGGLDESNLSAYLIGPAGGQAYVCVDAGTVRSGIEKGLAKNSLAGGASFILKNRLK